MESQPSAAGTDIVVTALRRDTTVQSTPISITAVTEEFLENTGSGSIEELFRHLPNVNARTNGAGGSRLSVRAFQDCGDSVDLIDAQAVNLPMLDRMYKEYPEGSAPDEIEKVTSMPLVLGNIHKAFDETGAPAGDDGKRLVRNFPKFADDLRWWAEAAQAQRAKKTPPY